MSKRNINIDRLQIRLRGVSSDSARSAANGIGAELLGQLATQPDSANARPRAISKIDAGKFLVSAETPASELRKLIALRIAESIKVRLGQRS